MAVKFKKTLLIIFLTLLIWVWADISNDTILTNQSATIEVSPSVSRELWVSLGVREGEDPIHQAVNVLIDLKGPSAKIEEFKREAMPLVIEYTPEHSGEEHTKEGEYSIPILEVIQNDNDIRRFGLTVEQCKPQTIKVKTEKLSKKQLKVICIDEDNNIIEGIKVQPAIIDMLVKDYWSGEKLKAYVKLTSSQIDDARSSVIDVKPYVELDPQRLRYWDQTVKVSIPTYTEQKITDAIPGPRVGFVFSLDMLDKYKVEIIESLPIVEFRATENASLLYKQQQYHVLLDILPDDATLSEDGTPKTITRKIKYNFPIDQIKSNKISAVEGSDNPEVSFKLIPLAK